jgi:hypothetical protein
MLLLSEGKMKYEELRTRIQEHPKLTGCVTIDRAPLITPGFPGTFNLSFTEDPWLKEYGRYVDFDKDYIFSTVQSCIRPEDIPRISTEDSWKYLGVFELADLTGIASFAKKPNYEAIQHELIDNLVRFITGLGIPLSKIHPSYARGDAMSSITEGKYTIDFTIPEDTISKAGFLKAGIPESNLIPDSSRDTFLCPFLRTSMPYSMPYSMPWGYRNEINVDISTDSTPKLLDVGTIEYILWKPRLKGDYKPENVVSIDEANFGVSLAAVGLERLCMATNGLKRVQDVDHLVPFYEEMLRTTKTDNLLAGESLRALHRIYADITIYGLTISRHQKMKIRDLIRNIPETINTEALRTLLTIHTETQSWHKNLQKGIEPTIQRIEEYRK